MTRATDSPELARDLAFMLTRDFQQHIALGNVTYPAIELGDALPEAFTWLIDPEVFTFSPQEVHENRRAWIDEWLNVSTR